MLRTVNCFALVIVGIASAAQPVVSGIRPGQRPGPYSSLVSVGSERGQSHCFICAAADRPAVIVFARTLGDPLGKLARGLDKALADHKEVEMRSWVTFLSDDQTALDPKVVEWSKKHSLRQLPLSVFEDVVGPPSYLIGRDADVTVLLSVKQKVVRNFAFRAGELNDEHTKEILESIKRITTESTEKTEKRQRKGKI